MLNKTLILNFNEVENNDTLAVFKNFFSNLAESLLTKLPNPLDKYSLESIIEYHSSFTITDDFYLNRLQKIKS